jgi:hypothetical protein
MLIHLYNDAEQQHDDGPGYRDANALKAFYSRAQAVITQRADFFVSLKASLGFVNFSHRAFST